MRMLCVMKKRRSSLRSAGATSTALPSTNWCGVEACGKRPPGSLMLDRATDYNPVHRSALGEKLTGQILRARGVCVTLRIARGAMRNGAPGEFSSARDATARLLSVLTPAFLSARSHVAGQTNGQAARGAGATAPSWAPTSVGTAAACALSSSPSRAWR